MVQIAGASLDAAKLSVAVVWKLRVYFCVGTFKMPEKYMCSSGSAGSSCEGLKLGGLFACGFEEVCG
ncbi:MAG: hypothetical protein QXF90_06785 [Thermofilaceae archaeon]